MLKARRPVKGDFEKVEKLSKKYDWPIPEKWVSAVVVEEGNNIIAFGCLQSNLEALIMIDSTPRKSYDAIINMLRWAIRDAKQFNHNRIIVFAHDPKFAKILEDHFNFKLMRGIPMMLEF